MLYENKIAKFQIINIRNISQLSIISLEARTARVIINLYVNENFIYVLYIALKLYLSLAILKISKKA